MNFFRNKHKEPVVVDIPLKTSELRAAISSEINELLNDDDCARFLLARDYDLHKTTEMIEKWYDYWISPLPLTTEEPMEPRNILVKQEIDLKEQIYADLLPHANYGESKEGIPVYWEKTGLISSRFQEIKKHFNEDELFVRHVRQQELMIQRCRANSKKHNKKIEKQIIVFDLQNLSYTLDFMALNAFRRTLAVDEIAYPERLQTLYMINTPIFFTTIWGMIRGWINPVTAAKIQIIGSKYQDQLKKVMDDDQIPVEYGGTRTFDWTWPGNHEHGKINCGDL